MVFGIHVCKMRDLHLGGVKGAVFGAERRARAHQAFLL